MVDPKFFGRLAKQQATQFLMNVEEQELYVGRTTPVQDAWARGQSLFVHGWIHRISEGLLRDMGLTISSDDERRAMEDG